MSEAAGEYQEAVAVIAHGLINTLSVVSGAAGVLRENSTRLSSPRNQELLGMIETQIVDAAELLRGLILGLAPEVVVELDRLNRAAATPPARPVRLRHDDRRRSKVTTQQLRQALTDVAWEAVRRQELLAAVGADVEGQPA